MRDHGKARHIVLGCLAGSSVSWEFGLLFTMSVSMLFEVGAASQSTAFHLISVVTGGPIIGRLAPNLLALRIGMFNVVIPCVIFTGALAFALIGAKTLASIVVVSVLYGLFSGAIISIVPMLAIQLCPNRGTVGNRIGMAFGVASIAILIGTPIRGNLLDNHGSTLHGPSRAHVPLLERWSCRVRGRCLEAGR